MKSTYKSEFKEPPVSALANTGSHNLADNLHLSHHQIDPPDAPSKPSVNKITARSCVLNWKNIKETEQHVINYHVYQRDSRDNYTGGWICINNSDLVNKTYTVTGLQPGHFYQFSVKAENEGGQGSRSTESNIIQAIERPSEPGRPHDIKTDCMSTFIEWTPPDFDGGTPITSYFIECRQITPSLGDWYPVNQGFVLGNQYFVSGLTSSCLYQVRVRATNKAGASEWSPLSQDIETIQPPSPPSDPFALWTTAASSKLKWSPPINDGGSPIKGYIIEQYREYSTFGWVQVNPNDINTDTTYEVTKLVKGKKYQFRVIAVNKKGPGKCGDPSSVIEAIEPPHSLSCISVDEITFQSCVINWAAPTDNGGAEVLSYIIKKYNGKVWAKCGSVDGHQYSYKVTGLRENVAYKFKVIAKNKAGEGHLDTTNNYIMAAGSDINDPNSVSIVPLENLESWGMITIRDSFQKGLGGVIGMIDTVLPLGSSISYPELKALEMDLRRCSYQALTGLKEASEKAEILKNELNDRLEEMKATQQKREQEFIEKKARLAEENTKLGEFQRQLTQRKLQLEDKKNEHRKCENSLRAARRELENKKEEQKTMRVVGGLTAIFGVGIGLLIISQTLQKGIDAARDNERTAEFAVYHAETRITDAQTNISNQQSQVNKTDRACDELKDEMSQLSSEIDSLQSQYMAQSDVSQRLKKCYTFVSRAAGKAEILDDQVQCFYKLHLIVEPLKQLTIHLSSGGDRLNTSALYHNGISLENFTTKLQMLTSADETWQSGVDHLVEHQLEWKVNMSSKEANEEMQLVEKANNTMSEVYNVTNSCEEWSLINATHAGWEEFIIPIPQAIAIQGQLMLVTTQRDFSVDKAKPSKGFKYLKRPNSFRACLLQITNGTWDAFHKGHINMDKIKMLSSLIPQHVHAAVDLLVNGTQQEVKEFLPKPLDALQRASTKSIKYAQEIEDNLMVVMATTAELIEACVCMQDKNKTKYQEVKITQEVTDVDRKAVEEQQNILADDVNNLKKKIIELEEDFEKAIGSLPSGWDIVGMSVCEGATNAIKGVFSVFSKPKSAGRKCNDKNPSTSDKEVDSSPLDPDSQKIYENAVLVCRILDELNVYLEGDSLNMSTLPREKEAIQVKIMIQRRKEDVERAAKSDLRKQMLSICSKSIKMCKEIQKMGKSLTDDHDAMRLLAKNIQDVQSEANILNLEAQSKMGQCSGTSSPILSKLKPRDEYDGSKGPTASTIDNCKRKVQLTSDMLRSAQDQYDNQCKKMQENSDNLSKVLGEIASLELQKMDLQQTIEVLNKSLTALADMRIQWGKIIQFFQRMSSILDCTLNVTLSKLMDMSKCSDNRAVAGYTMSHFRRDMLYSEVSQVANISHLVELVASSYVEVSDQYIMPRLNSLHKLMGYDPVREKESIKLAREQLIHECRHNQDGITATIKRKHEEYEQRIVKRIKCVRENIENVHPAIKITSSNDKTQSGTNPQKVNTKSLDLDDFC